MKLSLLVILAFLTTSANSQLEFYECPLKRESKFVADAELIPNKYNSTRDSGFYAWEINTGKSIVFKYSGYYSCDKTFHNAAFEDMVWAIPKHETYFIINLSDLDSLKNPFFFKTSCAPTCMKYNFDLISANGTIEGRLVNNKWSISANLKLVLKNKRLSTIVSKDIVIQDEFELWKRDKKYRKKAHKFYGF